MRRGLGRSPGAWRGLGRSRDAASGEILARAGALHQARSRVEPWRSGVRAKLLVPSSDAGRPASLLHGHLLVVRAAADPPRSPQPPLCAPRDYALVWAFHASGASKTCSGYGRIDAYFWLPVPPEGYRAVGFLATTGPDKPPLDDVRWVRADLTDDECETHGKLLHLQLKQPSSASPGAAKLPSSASPGAAKQAPSASPGVAFAVRGLRPLHRGMREKGIGAGTFCCAVGVDGCASPRDQGFACLKNVDLDLTAMPTLDQVHAIKFGREDC